ncbi:MAG TPA: class I SAM-dependent methyltransferase [Blastocatellia bacterium]|nr:class I SAM-dependent methyltransferase [Blastocatellia bacterium]
MNQLLDTIYSSGKVEDADGQPVACFPTSVTYETGTVLYDLIRQHDLQKTLEVGMAYGLSSLFICQALKDGGAGMHTAMDPAQSSSWRSIGLLNVERAGLGHLLRFFEASSEDLLPRLVADGERFDLAFIDGMHLFDYTLVEFFYIDRMLEVNGYVVFDDIWMPAIRKVIAFVLKNRAYQMDKGALKAGGNRLQHARATARRFLRQPFGKDAAIKLIPGNLCVLRKLADDTRTWSDYRNF